MKVVICDDNRKDLELAHSLCSKYLEEKRIDAEVSTFERWSDFTGELPDLLILDIEMPDKSGLDIMYDLWREEKPLILFVTGYEDYIHQAFGNNVMGFAPKPLQKDSFSWYMDRIMTKLFAGRIVSLEDGSAVSTEKIKMITADNRYTTVIFDDGVSSPLQKKSLSAWETDLGEVYFLRINQSALINSKFAIDFIDDEITMDNGVIMKCSRRRRKDCYAKFMEYNRKYAKPK